MMPNSVRESIEIALEQLHEERERIEVAIENLEIFLGNTVDATVAMLKHHQPPHMMAKTRSRVGWTDEARRAASERMRKYWESRRKNQHRDDTADADACVNFL